MESKKKPLSHIISSAKSIPKTLTSPKTPSWKRWITGIFTAVAVFFIFWIFYTIFNFFAHFSLSEVFLLFGDLDKDENNRTQVLVLGSGDPSHDSPDLTDTIMVVSLDHTDHTISIISLPRDLWIKDDEYGENRINKFYEMAKSVGGEEFAFDKVREVFGELVGADIQYYVKVDFTVFKEIIDIADGVDINLDYKLCDYQYPDSELIGYDPFCLEAGEHHIDGEMALRLARSRHGVHLDENDNIMAYSSDFDRAARQQMIIKALKDKITSNNLITSPTTVKELFDTYSANVKSNFQFDDIWALAGFATKMSGDSIARAVLSVYETEPPATGAFLYYPDRSLYGGASVVRPLGETFKDIQQFIGLLFGHAKFFTEDPKIEILNGTGAPGLATRAMDELAPFGFDIINLGNTESDVKLNKTICYFPYTPKDSEPKFPETRAIIKEFIPCVIVEREVGYTNPEGANITIELGADADF